MMSFKRNLFAISAILFIQGPALTQTQKGANIQGESGGDNSGNSVSMANENTVAIGAYKNDGNGSDAGHVRIYEWNGTAWSQKGLDIDGEAAGDRAGASVSMPDPNTVAVGSDFNDGNGSNAGHVRVFEWNGSAWVQKGVDIDGDASGDRAGSSVSMPDANTVAIGAWGNDDIGTSQGQVKVYEWDGSSWVQKGASLYGEAAQDNFGFDVSMPDPDVLAVGARYNDGGAADGGHVRVFDWNGTAWIQRGIDIDGEGVDDRSGSSISMGDINTIAIGAPNNDGNGSNSGHVRVYEWNGTVWAQKGVDIDGIGVGDLFGNAVSMGSKDTLVIGSRLGEFGGNQTGFVQLRVWNGSSYIISGANIYGEIQDQMGTSVSMGSTTTFAGGARFNDVGGNDIGRVQVYNYCSPDGSTDNITACDSYTWIDGNTYNTSNNTATHTLQNISGCDSVVSLDLTINQSSSFTDVVSICDDQYTWIDGNTYTSSNNTATHIITNSNGCDSTITLDLTLTNIDSTVSTNGATFTANMSAASYQWLDCDNAFAPISGESSQNFTATTNGNYAVEISQNGCVDTSACFLIDNVGLNKTLNEVQIQIFPNPSNGMVNLTINKNVQASYTLRNIQGKILRSASIESEFNTIDLNSLPKGIYLIEVLSTQEIIYQEKIVKH